MLVLTLLAESTLATTQPTAQSVASVLTSKKVTHPCAKKSISTLNHLAKPHTPTISRYAKSYQVDEALIKAVITIESCYKEKALSPKGARGLMQLIPDTAERFGVSNAYDSQENIRGGARYLGWLSKRFDGDLTKVLAAYNAGEGRVDQYKGIPPFRETRNYVHDVMHVYQRFVSHRQSTEQSIARQSNSAVPTSQNTLNKQAIPANNQPQPPRVAKGPPAGVIIGKPPIAYNVALHPERKSVSPVQQASQKIDDGMVTGGVSRPIPAARVTQAPNSRQPVPVVRKATFKQPLATSANSQTTANRRVSQVYNSPFKPGRAGWQANKAMAPQLYKQ